MSRNRMFIIGVITLLLGLHLRAVESFVLNEKASEFWAKKVEKRKKSEEPTYETYDVAYEDWWDEPQSAAQTPRKQITPPKWVAMSLISVGSVLILTCPCFR